MRKIGFVVNPVAGMGGAVGLKGTDGCVCQARSLGAEPISSDRAIRFLKSLLCQDLFFLTAGRSMGAEELYAVGIKDYQVVYESISTDTTATDSRDACRAFLDLGVELIVFCGGDGTARDVWEVTGQSLPILGIPAGVKIYSGVFATTPEAAAKVVCHLGEMKITDVEVMDVDEEAYRSGILSTHIYGIARIPYLMDSYQSGKMVTFGDDSRSRREIAEFITEIMRDDTLYLIGAGSTTQAITDKLGISSTLLGIDAVYIGNLIASDLNEMGILELIDRYDKIKIIISPIGAQGFVLGRGNQQISRRVLEKVGKDAMIIVATPAKLQHTKVLFFDTGDPALDERFGDAVLVICGYQMAQRVRVQH